jgi:hypothetical protein
VTANEKGRLPKFGPQSAAIREASGIIRTENLVYALRAHFDPARRFQPSEGYEAAMRAVRDEGKRRLSTLYDHYSIDATAPNAGVTLAYCLACDLIPRFNPMQSPPGKGKRGAPKSVLKKHRDLMGAILEITDTGIPVIQACRRLSKRNGPWKGWSPKVLQARYYRYAATFRAELAMQSVRVE